MCFFLSSHLSRLTEKKNNSGDIWIRIPDNTIVQEATELRKNSTTGNFEFVDLALLVR